MLLRSNYKLADIYSDFFLRRVLKELPTRQLPPLTCSARLCKEPYTKQNAWTKPVPFTPNSRSLPGFISLFQRGNKAHPISIYLLLTVLLFSCHSSHPISEAHWLLRRFRPTFYQHFTLTASAVKS